MFPATFVVNSVDDISNFEMEKEELSQFEMQRELHFVGFHHISRSVIVECEELQIQIQL